MTLFRRVAVLALVAVCAHAQAAAAQPRRVELAAAVRNTQAFAESMRAFQHDPRITETVGIENCSRASRLKVYCEAVLTSGPWTYGGGPQEGNLPGQWFRQAWPVRTIRARRGLQVIASEDNGWSWALNELP